MSDKDESETSSNSSEEEAEQVRIVLELAKDCHDRYKLSLSAPIAVPADTSRKGLSKIVNHLLSNDNDENESIPFDFMISHKLLRTGLEKHARRFGWSLEHAIPVTYFPAQRAPENTGESEKVPDWVACLGSSFNNVLFAGCYDGSVQVYNIDNEDDGKGAFVHTSQQQLHSGVILTLDVFDNLLVTGSMDQTIKVHTIENKRIRTVAECVDGHNAAVHSVKIQQSNNQMASGDWDGQVCLWNLFPSTSTEDQSQQQVQKKSKSEPVASATKSIWMHASTLSAHTSNVSGLSWTDNHALVTGSWDHSLKVWDVARLEASSTYNCGRVLSCLDTQPETGMVVTGHPDCSLKLWDLRNQDAVQTHTTLNQTSHKQWITDVQWSPTSSYHLASSSRDGTIKLWDIRSQLPLHTIRVSDDKVLCLQYLEHSIFGGGTDCVVKRFQFPRQHTFPKQ